VQFAQIIHGQPSGSGIPSTYVYSGGLNPRSDIAGLHLVQSPSEPGGLGADEDAGAPLEVRRRGGGGIAGFLRTQAHQVFEPSVFDVGQLTSPRLAS
jgi:hypothetical protein